MFNPRPVVRQMPIGHGQACIVIDDALLAPERLPAFAEAYREDFQPAPAAVFPGLHLPMPEDFTALLHDVVRDHARQALRVRRVLAWAALAEAWPSRRSSRRTRSPRARRCSSKPTCRIGRSRSSRSGRRASPRCSVAFHLGLDETQLRVDGAGCAPVMGPDGRYLQKNRSGDVAFGLAKLGGETDLMAPTKIATVTLASLKAVDQRPTLTQVQARKADGTFVPLKAVTGKVVIP